MPLFVFSFAKSRFLYEALHQKLLICLQVLLETQLDVEKSKLEQEKKKVSMLQEQLRDLVSVTVLCI